MIISDKHKFIFIAIYKNASTSIEEKLAKEDCFIGGPSALASSLDNLPPLLNHPLLFHEYWEGIPKDYHNGSAGQGKVRKHITARDLRQIMGPSYDNYRKFAVVRNPWDRVVSHYIYSAHNGKLKNGKPIAPFPEWCETINMRSNLSSITDESGNLIIDSFLYFENLQPAFNRMCQLLGIEPSKLSKSNVSPRLRTNVSQLANPYQEGVPYTAFYDERTKEIIREKFKDDIESLKYTFNNDDTHSNLATTTTALSTVPL